MVTRPEEMRHVVAWLPFVRWVTCIVLWVVVAAVGLFPHLNLPLRAIWPLGLAAASCRTIVLVLTQRGLRVPRVVLGVAWSAEAALLAGLLDLTGGPFNPFIVMYVTSRLARGGHAGSAVGSRRERGCHRGIRLVGDRPRPGRAGRAPSAERLSHSPVHDVAGRNRRSRSSWRITSRAPAGCSPTGSSSSTRHAIARCAASTLLR